MTAPFLIGRLVFGGFFLYNGINHFKQRRMLADYARSKGVPMADTAVLGSGVALLFGGASIISGFKPALGAAAIIGFLAGVTPVMHDFWRMEDPTPKMNEMINFSKNLALLGGATALMGVEEPWPASVGAERPGFRARVRRLARAAAAA
jgi:uncharacterized membrane protein YphA (DoxX/SURF4 family)